MRPLVLFLSAVGALPFIAAFKVAPTWVARHALCGCLAARGYSKGALPPAAVRALAADSLSMRFVHKEGGGVFADMAALYRSCDLTAQQVHWLMDPGLTDRQVLTTTAHTQELLARYGVQAVNQSADWRA